MTAYGSAQITSALTDLRHHWDEAYKITHHPGEAEPCHAERLDDGTVLTTGTPWALREKIIGDYSARPVPRMDNAPATATLSAAESPADAGSARTVRRAC
jgi:hypothetical protein